MMEIQLRYGAALFASEKISKIIFPLFFVIVLLCAFPCRAADKYVVLCYHDIPAVASSPDDIPQHIFVRQMEYLKTHGYEFISPEAIRAAHKGLRPLPEKAVLLTFDDAYLSFYKFVFPILKLYQAPAVLSVVSSWIEQNPIYENKPLMSWEQILEVKKSGYVSLSSHTHELHREIPYNSAGNVGPASSLFAYDPDEKKYEPEASFKKRISDDLLASLKKIEKQTGERPWILTWPYGKFNQIGMDVARHLGFEMILTLEDGLADSRRLGRTKRNMIFGEMGISSFITSLQKNFEDKRKIRAAQIDLDLIVNPSSFEESDKNLGLLIERLVALGINTVFLQGFCDTEGSGNIRSVYFPNGVLPVKMDFLSHAVHQIRIRDIKTFVWMPVLSFELGDKDLNESLKVRERKNGQTRVTTSWYRRLSPFDPKTLEIVKTLYRDLAANVDGDGLLFQDDLYLTDEEDFHPAALKAFREQYGPECNGERLTGTSCKEKWISFKTSALNRVTQEIMEKVKYYRPGAEFARNIYSAVVLNPPAQEWFSQNLEDFLKIYHYTVIMAYPQMENIHQLRRVKKWLGRLVAVVNRHQSQERVIFKIQSYDWGKKRWIRNDHFHKEVRYLLATGVKHLGYYPDDVFRNMPQTGKTSALSSKDLP